MEQQSEKFLDALLNLPSVAQVRVSPNKKQIALTISQLNANWDVFRINTEGTSPLTSVTNTQERTRLLNWWPDSESIIIAEDKGGNERLTLYRVFLDYPNKWEQLTPDNPNYYVRGTEISPDGKNLYYFVNYDFSTMIETEVFHLLRQDISTGEMIHLTTAKKPAYNYPSLNLAGTMILYNRSDQTPGGTQYWLVKTDGSEDREILNFGAKAKVTASWHPDSEHIIFTTDSYDGNRLQTRLTGIYSSSKDDIDWIVSPNSPKVHDFNRAFVPRFAPNILVLSEIQKATALAFFYDLEKKELTPFPRISGNLFPFQRLEGENWLGLFYSSIQPTTLVSFPEDRLNMLNFEDCRIYFDNFTYSSITKDHLVPAQEFEWKSEDGTPIHGWYYQARNPTNRAIIYVHGGPSVHSADRHNTEIQFYVSQGFHVLDPNYRGSTGYGVAFREAIKEDGWGGREQVDIATGAKALVDQGLVEPGRIGITGTSYGGFSAWSTITKFPEIFKASAPVSGMTDLVVDYETTRPDLRPYSAEMMGGTPEEVPERYHQGSPINYIQNIKGNILIVQGARDPNVTPTNVKVIKDILDTHQVNYEELIFEDEGHGIIKKQNQRTKILIICNFFMKFL